MDQKKRINNQASYYFLAGFFLILVPALTLVIQFITFLLNGSIGWWQFPLALALSIGLHVYLLFTSPCWATGNLRDKLFMICMPVILVFIAIIVSGHFYDVSPDGQEYHMEAVIQLAEGWNPYQTVLAGSSMDFLKEVSDGWNPYKMGLQYKDIYFVWLNHYPKGTEFIQAGIYAATGHIETGKSTNIIFMLASLFLTLSLLLPKLKMLTAWTISLLLMANPVAVAQMLTYCVDGVLASIFLIFIVSVILALKEKQWIHYLLILLTVILAFVIKFNAVVYIVILMGAVLSWMILNKEIKKHKNLIATFGLASILGILVGFNPYVTNTIKDGHPFYPVLGPKKVDIISYNTPPTFQGRSGAERFFVSLFSHTVDTSVGDSPKNLPQLKFPFTLSMVDFKSFWYADTRIAGLGPWFSGIFLLSIMLLIVFISKCYRDIEFKKILFILLTLIFTIVIMPESWWARYVPQLWYVPILLLLATELLLPDKQRLLKQLVYIALIVNVCFTSIVIIQNLIITSEIKHQLAMLKESSETIVVDYDASPSLRIRFQEEDIPYVEQRLHRSEESELIKRSSTRFLPPKNMNRNIAPPFIKKLFIRLGIELSPWGGIGN